MKFKVFISKIVLLVLWGGSLTPVSSALAQTCQSFPLADVTVNSDVGLCGSLSVDLGQPDDLCLDWTFSNDAPTFFEVGTTAVTWTAEHNVTGTVLIDTQLVTVFDLEPPEIFINETIIIVDSDPFLCGAFVDMPPATFIDNCVVDTAEWETPSGSFYDVGFSSNIFSVSDIHGNNSLEIIQIAVFDTTPPQADFLPDDIVVECQPGLDGAIVDINPVVTFDNCGVIDEYWVIPFGSVFPIGETINSLIVKDGSGNGSMYSVVITVTSSQADSDADGVDDCTDGCPDDPLKDSPGACGCNSPDTDTDGDGTPDCNDACPDDPLKTEVGICGCGVSDTDSDGDGT